MTLAYSPSPYSPRSKVTSRNPVLRPSLPIRFILLPLFYVPIILYANTYNSAYPMRLYILISCCLTLENMNMRTPYRQVQIFHL